jgi:hypothetical protein
MLVAHGTVDISRSLEEVFDYLADMPHDSGRPR